MTPNASKAIEDVYYNLLSAGAYAGPRKIYEILKQNHENAPSLYEIRQWLQSKDDYRDGSRGEEGAHPARAPP